MLFYDVAVQQHAVDNIKRKAVQSLDNQNSNTERWRRFANTFKQEYAKELKKRQSEQR